MSNMYGRKVIAYKVNKSGGGVIAGDVLVPDTTNDNAFTTTTSAAVTTGVWVADETIASNATGRVVISGHVTLINVSASVTRGHTGTTHTVAKQAVSTGGTTRSAGTFCKFTTGGTTPEADIWPVDLGAASAILPGTMLAVHAYGPAGSATVYNTSSASFTDVDATNMAITFTAPASGNVIVRMSSWADCVAGGEAYWGLREASSNLANTAGTVLRSQTPGDQAFVSYTVYVTGVSAGSHTYKWAFAADTSASGRHRIVLGVGSAVTNFAPAIMEVYAA